VAVSVLKDNLVNVPMHNLVSVLKDNLVNVPMHNLVNVLKDNLVNVRMHNLAKDEGYHHCLSCKRLTQTKMARFPVTK
jgi:hypothetical protein